MFNETYGFSNMDFSEIENKSFLLKRPSDLITGRADGFPRGPRPSAVSVEANTYRRISNVYRETMEWGGSHRF